jgi:ribosome-binding protein aMBF1 (putative translation factor)
MPATPRSEASPALSRSITSGHHGEQRKAAIPTQSAASDNDTPGELQILFGANLKAARVKANLSQYELAAQTSLTQQYLSRIEKGRKNVTIRTMSTLSKVLGLEVSTLLQRRRVR